MKTKGKLELRYLLRKSPKSRCNGSDKLRLIRMVHDYPILWDSRLPNYKSAEEERNRAWEHIGRDFNSTGRRAAQTFKLMRESFRRELTNVKAMGDKFMSKWCLYESMDFLRDVIRERKGGSHASDLTLSAFAHNLRLSNNNINNNNHKSRNNKNHNNTSSILSGSLAASSAALNL